MIDRQQVRRRLVLVFVAVLGCAIPPPAASQDVPDGYARFQLLNECKPMGLVVNPPDGAALSLTRERIRTLAESRLRAARLFSDGLLPAHLEVNVRVLGLAFAVEIRFSKVLYDPVSNEAWPSETWRNSAIGTHGRDGDYIMQFLSGGMDRFLLEYLRVNEDARR